MAPISLTDVFTYADGHDFKSDTNVARLEMTASALKKTNFGSRGWDEFIAGLKNVAFTEEGFWQAGAATVDPEVFPNLGGQKTFTMGPLETEGSVAYLWQAREVHYEFPRGDHGEIASFLLSSVNSNGQGAIRGQLALKHTTVTNTGSVGTAVNIVTSSGSYVYAALHVFVAGTSMSAVVESATESTFASPTTVHTFSDVVATGGLWATRAASVNGQNYYRYRVAGISGSFQIAGSIGVQ